MGKEEIRIVTTDKLPTDDEMMDLVMELNAIIKQAETLKQKLQKVSNRISAANIRAGFEKRQS